MQNKNRSLQSTEYAALYQEIQENTKSIYSILTICVTSFTGIISGIALIINGFFTNRATVITTQLSQIDYGLFSFPFLFLLPFLIIIPSITIVISSLNSTVRIATYIQVFYENNNENDVLWQTRIQEFRGRDSEKHRVLLLSLRSLFQILGFACIGFSLITELLVFAFVIFKNYRIDNINVVIIIFITLGYFISLLLLVRRLLVLNKNMQKKWKSEYFDELIKKWQDIKKGSSTT